MSRTFTTSSFISLGINTLSAKCAGASQVSAAIWVKPSSFNVGVADNRTFDFVINGASSWFIVSVNGATGDIRVGGRSRTSDGFQNNTGTTNISTGSWVALGGVLDFANDQIRGYTNGNQEFNTSVTFGSTTLLDDGTATDEDAISTESTTTTRRWKGQEAWLTIWDGDIGQQGMSDFAEGVRPIDIRPDLLVSCFPVWGNHSPEIDIIDPSITGVVTSASKSDEGPPVTLFSRSPVLMDVAAVVGGNEGAAVHHYRQQGFI